MEGWVCPVCGRGLSPFVKECPCYMRKDYTRKQGEERDRELSRSNYAAQLAGLGYNADGSPKTDE